MNNSWKDFGAGVKAIYGDWWYKVKNGVKNRDLDDLVPTLFAICGVVYFYATWSALDGLPVAAVALRVMVAVLLAVLLSGLTLLGIKFVWDMVDSICERGRKEWPL